MTTILTNSRKLRHRDDPESSSEAIERHIESGKRETHLEVVNKALRDNPGRTAAELHRKLGWPLHLLIEVRRRLDDLQKEPSPRAYRGAQRKCHVAKTKAVVWWPLRSGRVF
jgi:Arc/MetJ-type ribon-helix-helix transcriptional regulator